MVAILVSTVFRPAVAGYWYLYTKLSAIGEEARYPREDVVTLLQKTEWQEHANGARELVHVSLSAKKPFDGLPGSIGWNASGELRIEGLQKSLASAGVALLRPRQQST